jgi:hypothetical protein
MNDREKSLANAPSLTQSIERALSGHRVRVGDYNESTGALFLVYYSTAEERAVTTFDQMWNKFR